MIASTASRTGLSLLVVTLGVLALVAGPASAQGLGDSYGVCCYGAGEECADSDALTCAGGGYVFFPYAEDSSYNCDWYCGGGAPECGDGVPDSGECGPDGSCLEDCSEYKDCPDYSSESECSFAAGCQWYYDDYGYFGGDFCDQSLLFCGDGICEPEFDEDEDNCPRDCSERCGNGTVEGEEECEPSADDLECNEFCYYDVCGDGFVGIFEYCDAGMLDVGDEIQPVLDHREPFLRRIGADEERYLVAKSLLRQKALAGDHLEQVLRASLAG